jgi:GNAT superfamily N-acetyltransferase
MLGAVERPVEIDVLAATSEHLQAVLTGTEVMETRFGLSIDPGLDMFPGALARSLAGLDQGADPRWNTHLFVDVAGRRVVGFGGYKGPPVAGAVEIGYAVAPGMRGKGVATAAALELVERARRSGVNLCVAHTLPEENPSTAVLRRCGFTLVGETLDPEGTSVWRWELALGP